MLYKAIEPDDGAMAIFAAVHLLRWRREWGEPKLLFVEAEPADLLKDERVKALVGACHCAPLATLAHTMDIEGGGGDCVRRILDVLAPFKESPDG